VDAGRAQAAAAEFGGRACTDLDSVLSDPGIQAVHVCTPHNVHADQVVAAAKAGKHVLVEKPMALTVADCDRMIAACEAAGKLLMVGQVMRYYPVNRLARQMIADGVIGPVGHMMRRRFSNFNPTPPGSPTKHWYLDPAVGGVCVLFCFGPHEYDILPWYVQSPVVRVYSQGSESTELYKGQKDAYTTILTHACGAVSVISQCVVCLPRAQDQYIVGAKGSLFISGDQLLLNGEPVEVKGSLKEGMKNQVQEFADCVLQGRQPDANARSVRHTMAVIEAAKISAETNAPVNVQ
nr:Gfo/Idh/MocA family oxidoreductase [Candidatus Brocadiia bacterium]